MKAQNIGTIIVALDRNPIDPRFEILLGLRPPKCQADTGRKYVRVGVGQWTLPGGGCEDDESPLLCAQREFSEEVRLKLSQKSFQKVGTLDGYVRKSTTMDHVWHVHIFLVVLTQNAIETLRRMKVSHSEFVKVRWFKPNNLPSRMISIDRMWVPMIVKGHRLSIKVIFEGEIGRKPVCSTLPYQR